MKIQFCFYLFIIMLFFVVVSVWGPTTMLTNKNSFVPLWIIATLHNKFQIKSIAMLLRKKLWSLLCCLSCVPKEIPQHLRHFLFYLLSLLLFCVRKSQNVFRIELTKFKQQQQQQSEHKIKIILSKDRKKNSYKNSIKIKL